jgi:hypothetical protein
VRSPKNILIVILSLTTATGAAIAWQQYQELVQLRVAVANVAPSETNITQRADLPAPHPAAVTREPMLASPAEDAVATIETPVAGPRPNRGNDDGARMRALMDRPEIQRLMAIQERSSLDSRYADLFRNLSLSPDQLARFKDLLVEKRTAVGDVRAAAREQGLNARNDPAAVAKLVADTQAEIDATIRETLGESGFKQYETYEKTLPQRNVVNQLEQRLSYSSTPLTPQQTDQLVAILASSAQVPRGLNMVTTSSSTSSGPTPVAMQFRGNQSRITDETVNQARGLLAAPQIEALRQLQLEQQAQAELNAAMRNRSRDGGAVPSAGVPSAVSSGPVPQPVPSRAGG